MATEPLSPEQITEALAELPGWEAFGDRLSRTYSFARHLPAAAMAMHVVQLQEELNHHSDMVLSYNKLGISVNTHTVGRITALDVGLARRIEEIAPAHAAQ